MDGNTAENTNDATRSSRTDNPASGEQVAQITRESSSRDRQILARREQILLKKQRVEKLRTFLTLKRKLYMLIGTRNTDEIRDTYAVLHTTYNDIIKISNQKEKEELQQEMAIIYNKIATSITTKSVKKGHITDFDNKKDKDTDFTKVIRKRIITTSFDVIVNMLEEKGKINLNEIQTRFNISRRLAEEWVQILADYGIVQIKYLPVGGVEIFKQKSKIENV